MSTLFVGHHGDKLLEADPAVAVVVRLPHHNAGVDFMKPIWPKFYMIWAKLSFVIVTS
jgi:hypothetical protein